MTSGAGAGCGAACPLGCSPRLPSSAPQGGDGEECGVAAAAVSSAVALLVCWQG